MSFFILPCQGIHPAGAPPPLLSIKVGVTLPPVCRAGRGVPPSHDRTRPPTPPHSARGGTTPPHFHQSGHRFLWTSDVNPCTRKNREGGVVPPPVQQGTPPPPSAGGGTTPLVPAPERVLCVEPFVGRGGVLPPYSDGGGGGLLYDGEGVPPSHKCINRAPTFSKSPARLLRISKNEWIDF
jgi:hypothetical protein